MAARRIAGGFGNGRERRMKFQPISHWFFGPLCGAQSPSFPLVKTSGTKHPALWAALVLLICSGNSGTKRDEWERRERKLFADWCGRYASQHMVGRNKEMKLDFGVHSGRDIRQVPTPYLLWIVSHVGMRASKPTLVRSLVPVLAARFADEAKLCAELFDIPDGLGRHDADRQRAREARAERLRQTDNDSSDLV